MLKKILAFSIIALPLVGNATTVEPEVQVGRYQLVANSSLFLLDTTTGKVWKASGWIGGTITWVPCISQGPHE